MKGARTKEYKLYDSTYLKLKSRPNKSIVIEARIVVMLEEGEEVVINREPLKYL